VVDIFLPYRTGASDVPNYLFFCPKCQAQAERVLSFNQHADPANHPKCEKCGVSMETQITSPALSGVVRERTTYWNQGLGRVVHSTQEEEALAKKFGLERTV
jgi:predicted nucleic acid-binding Zn ribbon protein